MKSPKPKPTARATKRGTPVAMPKKTAKPTPARKVTSKPKSKMTPEDKAYNDLLNKYKGDVTKIPGFKNGRGTR